MRRSFPALLSLLVLVFASVQAVPGSPVEALDLGEGVLVPDNSMIFQDGSSAAANLSASLAVTDDPADRLCLLRSYYRRFNQSSEIVSHLKKAEAALRDMEKGRNKIEAAFILVCLAVEDKEDRGQYVRELFIIIQEIRTEMPNQPWARLMTALSYGTFPELRGNWFDEALYALCYGYDDARVQLAAGSFLLAMDLAYGGDERLQWCVYLSFTRAMDLAPTNFRLKSRIKMLINENISIPGYRCSKWLKTLIGQA